MADLDLMALLSMLSSQVPQQQMMRPSSPQAVPLANAAPRITPRQAASIIPYMPSYPGANPTPQQLASILGAQSGGLGGMGSSLGGGGKGGGGSSGGLLSGSGGKLGNMIGSTGDGSGAAFGTGAASGLLGMFGSDAGVGAGMSAMDIASAVGGAY